MCGFVLAFAQTGDRLPDQSLLDRMDSAIRHHVNEARYDEREHARCVADRFGTCHHEFLMEVVPLEIDTATRQSGLVGRRRRLTLTQKAQGGRKRG